MRLPLLRTIARVGVFAIVGTFAALIGVQYTRLIERNVAYASQVHAVERDIDALQRKRAQQLREIQRLSDPQGSIPEIHDRLHLVGDRETIIYLKRDPAHTDAPPATP